MELTYEITAEDFIAFNLNVLRVNPRAKRNITKGRIQGAVLILFAGILFGSLSNQASPLWYLVFVACAIAYFLWIPKYFASRIPGNVRKMLKNSSNKICGQKTLFLEDTHLRLVGEQEDNSYPYERIQQIIKDTAQYYIYIGEMEALIIPFSAFENEEAKMFFYSLLCEKANCPN